VGEHRVDDWEMSSKAPLVERPPQSDHFAQHFREDPVAKDLVGQSCVATMLDHGLVKPYVGPHHFPQPTPLDVQLRLDRLLRIALHGMQHNRIDALASASDRLGLEDAAEVMDFADLATAERSDQGAPIVQQLDDADLFQGHERLADRSRADAEALRQAIGNQASPRGEFPLKDPPQKATNDFVPEGTSGQRIDLTLRFGLAHIANIPE
jgi:hypothetical protein